MDSGSDDHRTGDAMNEVVERLRVKIFADGADRNAIAELATNPVVSGFTTNPTLMRAAGVEDYEAFARDIVELVPELPISLEVFSDDFGEMERQARTISQWGGERLREDPRDQHTRGALRPSSFVIWCRGRSVECHRPDDGAPGRGDHGRVEWLRRPRFVSVFAGRIADTGRDPSPIMARGRGRARRATAAAS